MKALSVIGTAIFAVVVAIILCWIIRPLRYYPRHSPGAISRRLETALPIGTDNQRVLAYLDGNGLEHSPYQQSSRTILAIDRNTCWVPMLIECSTQLRFHFDNKGILIRTTVAEIYTGT